VEASVSGRRRGDARAPSRAWLVSVARLGGAAALVALVVFALAARRQAARDLERERSALLEAIAAEAAGLAPSDRDAVARDEAIAARYAGAYEGDLVAPELRVAGALDAMLAEPMVYVRAPISAFADAATTTAALSESSKDALLLCLVDPPASRAEKTLLPVVRTSYGGGALEQQTPHARPLYEAMVGLPFLLPPWTARVRAAEEHEVLVALRRELDKAPLDRAKRAASAKRMLLAIDEPGDGPGPTELDGERAHWVRVILTDVDPARPLLRIRRRVDPSGLTPGPRDKYARGLDACALALDVREAASPTTATARVHGR
jgi:hypothetical protein